jgi:hypothetical protein
MISDSLPQLFDARRAAAVAIFEKGRLTPAEPVANLSVSKE